MPILCEILLSFPPVSFYCSGHDMLPLCWYIFYCILDVKQGKLQTKRHTSISLCTDYMSTILFLICLAKLPINLVVVLSLQSSTINSTTFSRSFREWKFCQHELVKLQRLDWMKCPPCTVDQHSCHVDGNMKLYRYKSPGW